jgi:coniferyl-aldehyde dehydrogenase
LASAVRSDSQGRSREEILLTELLPAITIISHAQRNLARWMKPARSQAGDAFLPAMAFIYREPLGLVGIRAAARYPVILALEPLAMALAAGNRVMLALDPSAPATSGVLAKLVQEVLPEDQVAICPGGHEAAEAFAALPFDLLLDNVGAGAAPGAEGAAKVFVGKSPAIVSDWVPLSHAAARIAFGKAFGAGQTAVAPDYVLCPRRRIAGFVRELRRQFVRLFPTLRDHPHYAAIADSAHYGRLHEYLRGALELGARLIEINPADERLDDVRKLPLTLMLDTTEQMQVRQAVIRGPLLPIVPYDSLDEALAYVRARPAPPALYYFDYDSSRQQRVLELTQAGGVSFNDTLCHVLQEGLPFGGVGQFRLGQYHGERGFVRFSHVKSVFRNSRANNTRADYPPLDDLPHLIYRLFLP